MQSNRPAMKRYENIARHLVERFDCTTMKSDTDLITATVGDLLDLDTDEAGIAARDEAMTHTGETAANLTQLLVWMDATGVLPGTQTKAVAEALGLFFETLETIIDCHSADYHRTADMVDRIVLELSDEAERRAA